MNIAKDSHLIKGHSHVAKWISEFTLSVANDDSGDALLPSFVLAVMMLTKNPFV